MLSAFCKSLRGSDSTAALGWAALLLAAGCDPHLIVRRVMAHASEDVGLADPMAMVQAVSAMQALNFMGMPEAKLPIAQAIIYVCEAPKSNAVVMAIDRAMDDAKTMRRVACQSLISPFFLYASSIFLRSARRFCSSFSKPSSPGT